MKRRKKNSIYLVILLGCIVLICMHRKAEGGEQLVQVGQSTEEQIELSNNHTADADIQYELANIADRDDQQIIEHVGYTVSYSGNWNIPYWVAYELTDIETEGEELRSKSFTPDPEVKGTKITHKDYTNSSYDRGHMAPAADMKWSAQAMKESFYTSNICPQHHNLNNGDWKSLEEQVRNLANKYGSIYIVSGPIVDEDYETIGPNQNIAVPTAFYKVLLRRLTEDSWTAIGFVFPNEAGTKKNPLMVYTKTIDEVEELTGIDFFYNLPDSIEKQVEADFNIADWTI